MMKKKGCCNNPCFLTYATRMVFSLLVLLSASQITCTVIFMLVCRRSARDLVLTLDLSVDPCIGQGIPAYMASLVLLVTVLGFGCLGRKATSVILIFLGICDVGVSIYLLITQLNQNFGQIETDLNNTLSSCAGDIDVVTINTVSNTTYTVDNNFRTCSGIYTLLTQTCTEIISLFSDPLPYKNMQACSSIIIQSLTNIKFKYYPVSLPLMFLSSIMYIVLSMSLFYIQHRDKKLPGYRRREHILHAPEFRECSTKDTDETDIGAGWTLKLCLLNLLWCRCAVLFKQQYCCGVRQSRRDNRDMYEFEALPMRLAHEEPMTSVTQLV
ncbi:uncharacterized protein LOC124111070 [Haliotis rufescens]|uniref:uncharacterized protein LOC124111070 n=1 Tax=Haliotis rufescens TaxID=6454 RepID=UPI00201EE7FB|nr:uncharacterized protein LOC124111070 [Haliotis rufescens]XP_046326575.2 uncharacterized protein LOC124111070 [Haliotis rufescens]